MVIEKHRALQDSDLLGIIQSGGVCILPCDTIYGFVGRSSTTENRIRKIKGRSETKQFIRLISGVDDFYEISATKINEQLLSLWPGPLTIIVAHKEGGTVAVRVPNDPFLQSILHPVDEPLISTSVNRTGEKPLWKIREIIDTFESEVDLIVDGGDFDEPVPSTIVDATCTPNRIIRQGACTVPESFLQH
jgi:L-threonylcarbamoyladenylate synthase